MSKISILIDKSGWSFGVVKDSIQVLGNSLGISWIEYLDELMQTQEFTEEISQLEQITECILQKGNSLLKEVRSIGAAPHDLTYKIATLEDEDGHFAREMSVLRCDTARILSELDYEFEEGLGKYNVWLGEMNRLLQARNASPLQPLLEENVECPISLLEKENAEHLRGYIEELGWQGIPLGEREISILCLCQHLYSLGDFSTASECLVDAMEAGVQDPLIYYNYFVLGLCVGEYEAAMEGYKLATENLPVLALAPSDRYVIESIITKNRLYTSFYTTDNYEQQPVIIKVFNNPPANVRQKILQAVKLKHSGIGEIFNFHEINKTRPCLATEYIEGPSIETFVLEQGAIELEIWLQMAMQLANSLAYAHEHGIIHGNITPATILFNQDELKLIDFCISPLDKWPVRITNQDLPGIYYLAPELLKNIDNISPASDVYSLVMSLYFMLTGEPPHPLQSEKIPVAFIPVFSKATNYDPQKRQQSANELLADLAQASEEPLTIHAAPKKEENESVSRNRMIKLDDGGTVILPEKFLYREGIIYSQLDESQMVFVQEGPFSMGSNERSTEEPVHKIFLGGYLIDKTPVTNVQYARFLDYIHKSGDHSKCHPDEPKGKDHTPKNWQTTNYKKYSATDNSPVVFIDWWDAWAYASWAGKALPSEAQWEKAARGVDGRKYPWGNSEISEQKANYGNLHGVTTAVGSFPQGASSYGCLDMAGNVWEWCIDNYDKSFYRQSPRENPVCNTGKSAHTLRGGSWNDGAASLRTTCRGCWINIVRYAYIGFRCVKAL